MKAPLHEIRQYFSDNTTPPTHHTDLYNPDFEVTDRRPDQWMNAAVLIPIIDHPTPTLLFTLRSDQLPHHPGQVSFPGGKVDDQDKSVIDTALRETEEELAIEPSSVEVLGTLPKLHVLSGFVITPVVGVISADTPMTMNTEEVSDIFEAPLAHCLDPYTFSLNHATHNNEARAFYSTQWRQWTIWGVTAAIIMGLQDSLRKYSTN